jgi:hypothetical protein
MEREKMRASWLRGEVDSMSLYPYPLGGVFESVTYKQQTPTTGVAAPMLVI